MNAMRAPILGRVFKMSRDDDQPGSISPVNIAFIDAVISLVLLLPFVLVFERTQLQHTVTRSDATRVWVAIGLGSAIATAFNLSLFTLNKLTSSVTQGIYSLTASCLIVVLAACTDHQTSPLLWAGVVTVVVGGAAYGWFKL